MLKLSSYITIGNYAFDYVNHVEIKQTWKELTQTASITLPRKINMRRTNLTKLIKIGDLVSISLGYNGDNNTEFIGYVSGISPKVPFVVHCEDAMWPLKQVSMGKYFTNASLKDIIAFGAPQYAAEAVVQDIQIGYYAFGWYLQGVLQPTAPARVFESLKEYGIYVYFKNNILHAGFPYPSLPSTINYDFNTPSRANIIEDRLEYRSKAAYKVKVVGKSLQPNNTLLTFTAGDEGGDTVTYQQPNLTAAALETFVNQALSRIKVDGWRGNFTTFGQPFAQFGDIANLTDTEFPERNGSWFIDKTETKFGTGGFRREIFLGPSAGSVPVGY